MISDNLKKTILGIVAGVMAVAVTLGWFTPEESLEVQTGIADLLENIGGVILGVIALFGIFTGRSKEEENAGQ